MIEQGLWMQRIWEKVSFHPTLRTRDFSEALYVGRVCPSSACLERICPWSHWNRHTNKEKCLLEGWKTLKGTPQARSFVTGCNILLYMGDILWWVIHLAERSSGRTLFLTQISLYAYVLNKINCWRKSRGCFYLPVLTQVALLKQCVVDQ